MRAALLRRLRARGGSGMPAGRPSRIACLKSFPQFALMADLWSPLATERIP